MAALSLGRLEHSGAVDPLIEIVRSDGDDLPRQAALAALGQIGDLRATDVLIESLGSPSPDLRFQATAALVQVNPEAAHGPLRATLSDEDPEVRASAVAALGDLHDQDSIDDVAPMLEDPVPDVCLEAALTLSRLGDPRGPQRLAQFLKHKEYCIVAAENLFRSAHPCAIHELRRILHSWLSPGLLKVWAAAILAKLADPEGKERLLSMLNKREPMVRGLVIQLLGELAFPWCRNALESLLLSTNGAWRSWRDEIDEALEKCGHASAEG
jgi:HEAT repeat protein